MRKLYKQDIVEILYGVTLLGAGGGGSLCFGLDMLAKLDESKEIIGLEMLDVDEMEDDTYAAMVAGLGPPWLCWTAPCPCSARTRSTTTKPSKRPSWPRAIT